MASFAAVELTHPGDHEIAQPSIPHFGVLVGLWLVLRIIFSLWAAFCSTIRPLTPLEQTIPLWPPSVPLTQWLDRVLVAPWLRWDVTYYLNIATQGYRLDDGTAQFHPLYPLLGWVAGSMLGGNMLLGLLVVSSLSALLSLFVFARLAQLDLAPESSLRTILLFALLPVSFILFAPYSESLFMLCSLMAFLYARQERWWLAGLAGGLAALTRQQGIFLLIPLAWEFWEASGRQWQPAIQRWRSALGLALIPAGLLAWLIFRGVALGDLSFDPTRPQTLIYSLLISKSSAQVVPIQGFVPPWQVLQAALQSLDVPGSHTTIIDLVLGGVFLMLLLLGGRFLWRMRPSYLLYSAVILLVSFSYYTGPFYPTMGLPRHCLLAFPLFFPLGVWSANRWLRLLLMTMGLLGSLMLLFFYSLETWVP